MINNHFYGSCFFIFSFVMLFIHPTFAQGDAIRYTLKVYAHLCTLHAWHVLQCALLRADELWVSCCTQSRHQVQRDRLPLHVF